MTLGECRRLRLMSLRDVAAAANVGVGTVHAIENGRRPSLRTIGKISRALSVDPMEITEFRAVIQGDTRQGKERT